MAAFMADLVVSLDRGFHLELDVGRELDSNLHQVPPYSAHGSEFRARLSK